MQRFYFDFHDGDRHTQDAIGVLYATEEAAIHEALIALSQVVLFEGTKDDHRSVECDVRDATGRMIYWAELALRGKADGVRREAGGVMRGPGLIPAHAFACRRFIPCGASRQHPPRTTEIPRRGRRQSLPKRWRRVMQIRKALEPHTDVGRVENQQRSKQSGRDQSADLELPHWRNPAVDRCWSCEVEQRPMQDRKMVPATKSVLDHPSGRPAS